MRTFKMTVTEEAARAYKKEAVGDAHPEVTPEMLKACIYDAMFLMLVHESGHVPNVTETEETLALFNTGFTIEEVYNGMW